MKSGMRAHGGAVQDHSLVRFGPANKAHIDTHTHVHVHPHLHVHIHTYMHTCMHACMHARTLACIHGKPVLQACRMRRYVLALKVV